MRRPAVVPYRLGSASRVRVRVRAVPSAPIGVNLVCTVTHAQTPKYRLQSSREHHAPVCSLTVRSAPYPTPVPIRAGTNVQPPSTVVHTATKQSNYS